MTIYRTPPVWTEIRDVDQALSAKALGYFRARLKNRLHQLVLSEFQKLEANSFTRANLAKRVHKKPEQITRFLAAPGNWTLDTVSDLLLAMGCELDPKIAEFDDRGFSSVTSEIWEVSPKSEVASQRAQAGTTALI